MTVVAIASCGRIGFQSITTQDASLDAAGSAMFVQVIAPAYNDTLGHGTMLAGNGFIARAVNIPFNSMVEDNAPAGTDMGTYQATALLPPAISDACWIATAAAFRIAP